MFPVLSFSQITISETFGKDLKFNPNNSSCITQEAKEIIQKKIQININNLKKQGKLSVKKSTAQSPTFIWPVKKSSSSTYNEVWAISNYVDHNASTPNNLQDYNCGTRTYDTDDGYNHAGTDIFTWPFFWDQMENNIAEVVAAAPGTIITKSDGQFDKNCSSNSNPWNAIYLQHSDGSVTWYGHLKNGSLTSKSVGDTVEEGEYLGIVGSSGNSTGPHLHFEVYDNNNNLIDPFSGSCNNITSWWKEQPDYTEPQINAVLTHSDVPNLSTCPEDETTNIQNKFLPNSDIYMIAYFKDQLENTLAYYRVFDPNNILIANWSESFTTNSTHSYWGRKLSNLATIGTYRLEVRYEGKVVNHSFEINTTLGIDDEKLKSVAVSPNPFENDIKISGFALEKDNYYISVFNQLGQKIVEKDDFSENLDLHFLSKGMYFLNIGNKITGGSKTFKIIKK